MTDTRRISSTRWWNRKNLWILLIFSIFLIFIRISKGSFYKDLYYFISKPFWPGQFQREILLKSSEQEIKIKLDQLQKDNLRLRKLLSLQRLSDKDKINSSIISRKSESWWNQLILNKGEKDGVLKGDAVLGPGGLIGMIDNTSFFTSTVKLLTSPSSKVGAWIQKDNIHGLLVGVGDDTPRLIFYSKNIDVEVGDFILSSPASTLLPPNIPIGIIESVDKQSNNTISASVQLIAKPQAIDWVQILKMKI